MAKRRKIKISNTISVHDPNTNQNASFSVDSKPLSQEELQKEMIGEDTTLLYFVYRDQKGFHAGWVWSEDKEKVISYLFDALIARSLRLEHAVKTRKELGFGGTLGRILLNFKKKGDNSDPALLFILGAIAASIPLVSNKDGDDLNALSEDLSEVFTEYYYSVMWTFVHGKEGAISELKAHGISPKARDLRALLKRDVSI